MPARKPWDQLSDYTKARYQREYGRVSESEARARHTSQESIYGGLKLNKDLPSSRDNKYQNYTPKNPQNLSRESLRKALPKIRQDLNQLKRQGKTKAHPNFADSSKSGAVPPGTPKRGRSQEIGRGAGTIEDIDDLIEKIDEDPEGFITEMQYQSSWIDGDTLTGWGGYAD